MTLSWWALAPLIGATIASLAFTILFGVRSRWHTNPIGKMQFHKSVTMSTVFLLIMINGLTPEYPLEAEIRIGVFWLLAIALWGQVYMLILVQQGKIQGPNYGRRHDDVIKHPGQEEPQQVGDIEMQERM